MALNVSSIKNNNDDFTVHYITKAKQDPNVDTIGPGNSSTKTISLEDEDNLEIYAGNNEKFQIGFGMIKGQPSLKLTRDGNKWIVKNIGTNTETSIIVGPDGQ